MQPSQTLLHDHQKLSTSVLNTTKNQKQLCYFVKVKSWTLKNSVLDSNLLPCPRIGITNDYEHNGRRKRIIWFTESTNSCKTLNLVMALKNKKGSSFFPSFFFPLSRAQNIIKGQKEIILLLKSEGFFVKDYGIWKGVEFSGRALSNVHTFCMYLLSLSLSVRYNFSGIPIIPGNCHVINWNSVLYLGLRMGIWWLRSFAFVIFIISLYFFYK